RSAGLSGKTVGELWDYLFKGEEMFPLIRKALETRYPGIRFVEFETFGSIHGRDEKELAATLPALLRKHGCDARISAVGACGSRTPAVLRPPASAERRAAPSVPTA